MPPPSRIPLKTRQWDIIPSSLTDGEDDSDSESESESDSEMETETDGVAPVEVIPASLEVKDADPGKVVPKTKATTSNAPTRNAVSGRTATRATKSLKVAAKPYARKAGAKAQSGKEGTSSDPILVGIAEKDAGPNRTLVSQLLPHKILGPFVWKEKPIELSVHAFAEWVEKQIKAKRLTECGFGECTNVCGAPLALLRHVHGVHLDIVLRCDLCRQTVRPDNFGKRHIQAKCDKVQRENLAAAEKAGKNSKAP